jgi:ubiquitin C
MLSSFSLTFSCSLILLFFLACSLSSVCFVQLEEDRTLADYNVQKESTLHLVLRLVGGSRLLSSGSGVSGSGSNPQSIQLFIKTLTGKTLLLHVDSTATVGTVKQLISDKEGVESRDQRLIFAGKQLIDDRALLTAHKVEDESTMHLVTRLLGAADKR